MVFVRDTPTCNVADVLDIAEYNVEIQTTHNLSKGLDRHSAFPKLVYD
jgi:hypothetical protein